MTATRETEPLPKPYVGHIRLSLSFRDLWESVNNVRNVSAFAGNEKRNFVRFTLERFDGSWLLYPMLTTETHIRKFRGLSIPAKIESAWSSNGSGNTEAIPDEAGFSATVGFDFHDMKNFWRIVNGNRWRMDRKGPEDRDEEKVEMRIRYEIKTKFVNGPMNVEVKACETGDGFLIVFGDEEAVVPVAYKATFAVY